MSKPILGYTPLEFKQIGQFKILRFMPYYKEYVCSDNAKFINAKTGQEYGSSAKLYIRNIDSEGNLLPEEQWTYDTDEDIMLVDEGGTRHVSTVFTRLKK